MADKMMRIAGRDGTGLAKPIKTDADGNISVQMIGGKLQRYELASSSIEPGASVTVATITKAMVGNGFRFLYGEMTPSNGGNFELSVKQRNDGGSHVTTDYLLTESQKSAFSYEILSASADIVIKNVGTSAATCRLFTNVSTEPSTYKRIATRRLFNNREIRSATVISSGLTDLSRYKNITFVAFNTHDKPVTIYPQFGAGANSYYWNGTDYVPYSDTTRSVTLPSRSSEGRYLLNTFFTELNEMSIPRMVWVAKTAEAPTTGALTIEVWGELL